MLNDFERKILRIIVNYAGQQRRIPRMDELENKTGRSRAQIRESLLELERKGYIAWGNPSSLDNIQILQAWEQEPGPMRKAQPAGSAVKYFTEY
ncbi:helix-turn-helix domain-containing protein [Paenibacillus sp. TC-CSREp1]|uniref:helix-turn-helix domain-containing protein n=1 Tax=Paenibacillus sp. TC-CSREp1 TaxID=3410089 RepID=UPI003CEC5458